LYLALVQLLLHLWVVFYAVCQYAIFAQNRMQVNSICYFNRGIYMPILGKYCHKYWEVLFLLQFKSIWKEFERSSNKVLHKS
jgi:hypothetical protein